MKKCLPYVLYGFMFYFLISCTLEPQNQEIIYGREGYYKFNPETILIDIEKGKESAFEALNITPIVPDSLFLSTVQWTEKDFYKVFYAAHNWLWDEKQSDWNFRHASFSLDCPEIHNGPQFASFVLNKVVSLREQESLVEHRITIDISNNTILMGETEYYPTSLSDFPTVLTDTNISIQEALKIAEQQGGKEIRENVSNHCQIRITLFGNTENWVIEYHDPLSLFEINVNAITGKYQFVN